MPILTEFQVLNLDFSVVVAQSLHIPKLHFLLLRWPQRSMQF